MPKSDKQVESDTERTSQMSDSKSLKDTQKNRMEEFFESGSLRTNPFGDNISAEQGYKRGERITAAVHLMTSHIEHDEPMRHALRAESILLLDYALLLQGELRAVGSEHVRKMQGSIRKLISLVRLAGISGRVSTQNAHILVAALDDLGSFLTAAQRSTLAEAVPLSREDLIPRTDIPKKEIRVVVAPTQKTPYTRPVKDISIKDNVRKDTTSASRANRILDIVKKGGLLGIKDIVALLPEYSEKMVQRELAAMTDSGQVRKIGEKRWSKYESVR